MARIVEFHSSEQPYMSMSEAMYYRLVDPLVYRDLDGALGDITAACCRRCGEVTLRSDKVGNHLCMTQSRTDRLVERGMEAFHAVVSRNDQLAAAQERIAALEAALGWALAATDACRNELMPEWYTWSEQARAALAGSQGGGGEEAIGSCMGCGGEIRLVNGEPVGPCQHCMPAVPADIPQAPTLTPFAVAPTPYND